MKENRNILFVVLSSLSIVAGVVGIGFVSGREIVSFFFKYEPISILVAGFVCVLFFIITYKKLLNLKNKNHKLYNKKSQNNSNSLKILIYNNNYYYKKCFNVIIGVLCLFSCGAMIAGFRELIFNAFNGYYVFEIIMTIFIIFIASQVISHGIKWITRVSSFFTFILIFIMVINIIYNFNNDFNFVKNYESCIDVKIVIMAITSSVFYVSMNSLSVSGVVSSISTKIKNRLQAFLISILSSIFLFLLLSLVLITYKKLPGITLFSMPLLGLSKFNSVVLYFLYFIAMFCGAIVSIISVSYSGCVYIIKSGIKLKFLSCFFLIFAFFISFLGFEFLVEKIYPLIGMIYLIVNIVSFCFIYKNNDN